MCRNLFETNGGFPKSSFFSGGHNLQLRSKTAPTDRGGQMNWTGFLTTLGTFLACKGLDLENLGLSCFLYAYTEILVLLGNFYLIFGLNFEMCLTI